MIGGAARRRRPVVGVGAGGDTVCQRHPLADRAVLDDVIVGWTVACRYRPGDVKTVAERSNGQV